MSLDTLLKRLIETPETPHVSPDVSPKPAWIKAETPETSETCQKTITVGDESVSRLERQLKVLAMLDAAPDQQRAVYADTDSNPDSVILAVAIRHVATFEMLVPKAKYDPWRLLALMDDVGELH